MSSTRSRMSIALSAKIRGENSLVSSPDEVDVALSRYAYIKPGVENIIRRLQAYLVANHHESEASVSLGQSLLDMYGESDDGRSVAAAFYATRTDSYTANIRTGLVVGILEGKLIKWLKELEELDIYVTRFKEVRIRYNHYVHKVMELEHNLDECEKKKKGNTSTFNSVKFKLIRNIDKLNEVEEKYNTASEECCAHLNKAWSQRLDVLRDIFMQLSGFLELLHGRELMLVMGLIQLLSASAGRRWVENSSNKLAPSIPVQTFVHKAGVLRRRQFLKAKFYCRLVGGLLEIYTCADGPCVVHGPNHHHDKDSSKCQHELLLTSPRQKHSVKSAELLKAEQGGESGGLTTGLNVIVDDSHMELAFYSSSPEEAQAWVDAFLRASRWDPNACQHEQEKFQKDVESRNEEIIKLLPASLSELVGVMGIAEIMERLPPPPPNIPPSITEEMGMKVSSKYNVEEGEMSGSTSPVLGRCHPTNVGLYKHSTTMEKGKLKRPLSVSLPLPLSPSSPAGSDGFQLPQDNVCQRQTVSIENPSESYTNKELSKGVMKLLSKKIANSRRKYSQYNSSPAIWSPDPNSAATQDTSPRNSQKAFSSVDSRASVQSNASDSEASLFSGEKRKSAPSDVSPASSVQREELERSKVIFHDLVRAADPYLYTNDMDLSLSVESLLDWDELQDLIKEGWIREKEVLILLINFTPRQARVVWKECATVDGGRIESFIRFITLMGEKRFEKELAANHGVRLIPGAVYEL